jgi:hypothetical protein
MKLRIRGNTLRLRLTRTEVEHLIESGTVAEAIGFGPSANDRFEYILELFEKPGETTAELHQNRIVIGVSRSTAEAWAVSEQEGIEAYRDIGGGDRLRILIEKDLACLKPREGEDESDSYPNPNADAVC